MLFEEEHVVSRLLAKGASSGSVLFPLAHHVGHFLIRQQAAFLSAQDLVDGVAGGVIAKSNLGTHQAKNLDETKARCDDITSWTHLTYLSSSGAGVELDCVKLSVHEVEPRVDGPTVDSAEDLLFRRWPLSSACTQRLVEALNKTRGEHDVNIETNCNHSISLPTFSANLAYFPSSVTKSAEHFFRWARRYFLTARSAGKITEQASANNDQWRRLTRELGSGWSVVCLISCRNSSLTKQSFFIALSSTVWMRNTWSSSSRDPYTSSPDETKIS